MLGGSEIELPTFNDIGTLGGAVLVVQIGTDAPIVAVDPLRTPAVREEPPEHPSPAPFLVARYNMTVTQVVVWPDSSKAATVGDKLTLDVGGGTQGCFTLVVPNAVSLAAEGNYLIAAGVRNAHQLVLFGDDAALAVTNGVIGKGSNPAELPAALRNVQGQRTSDLPSPTIVPSLVKP